MGIFDRIIYTHNLPIINLLTDSIYFSVRKKEVLGGQRPPKDLLGGLWPLHDPWGGLWPPKIFLGGLWPPKSSFFLTEKEIEQLRG